MRMTKTLLLRGMLFAAAAFSAGSARAEEAQGSRYACMEPTSINIDPTLANVKELPAIKSNPSAIAMTIGIAPRIIIVKQTKLTNGYLSAILFSGKEGWINADSIQPYHNLRNPETTCHVIRSSAGKLTYRLH